MSYARHLRRSINTDLVAQIEASGKVTKRKPVKSKREPRLFSTYRWARRNVSHHKWRLEP